jgi:hypothetical protein
MMMKGILEQIEIDTSLIWRKSKRRLMINPIYQMMKDMLKLKIVGGN